MDSPDTGEATVLDAVKYGADPTGIKDNAKAIQKVIAAAKDVDGPVIIDFPEGEYHIYPDKIEERELYVTNTVGTNGQYKMKKIGFLFEGMEDVTLRGNGSMFMFHGKMTTFATINSRNIKFEDFSFDFRTPTVIDVTVESVDGNTATMFVPECYDYSVNGTTIQWKSDASPYTGQLYWTTQNSMAYKQICDIKTGLTYRGGSNLFGGVTQIEEAGNHKLKFTYSNRPADIVPGKCYQMRPTVRDHAGMFFWKSSGVMLKDINLHFLHGFGIVGQHSEDLTLDHVIFQAPEGSGRTTVGYADFIQMSGCKGKVTMRNCSFSNPHDDPINIHGTFNQVVEVMAPNKFKVRYMHNETAGFPNYFVGDEVEFVRKDNLITVEDSVAKVVDVQGPTGEDGADKSGSGSLTDIIITLDRDVAGIQANTHMVENITYTPEVLIENNIFKETPTRGVLVTTRKKVVIRDNIFDGMGMASIYISNDANGWYESGAVYDVTIEGNTFYRQNPGAPAVYIEPTNPNVSTEATVHKNIKIRNNDFYMQNGKVLDAKSVNGISFMDNRIFRYDPGINVDLSVSQTRLEAGETAVLSASASGNSHSSELYRFNGCKEVVISGNTYDGGLKLGGSKANMDDSDIIGNTDGIAIGGSAQMLPAVGAVSYEVAGNDGVIKVSHDGKVTALKDGTAKVRAYTIGIGDKKYASGWKTITVGKPGTEDASLTIMAGKEVTQEHGEEIQYSAKVTPDTEKVSWSVVDAATGGETTHATIDADGKLTTISNGAVEVVATTTSGLEARKLLVINQDIPELGTGITVEYESNANQANWQANADGTIQTKALAGGIWDTQTANNIFSCPLDAAENVTVTVKLDGKTQSGWQEAGLLLFKDTDNYVFIGRKHGGGTPKIKVVTEQNQNPSEGEGEDDISSDAVYLKLEKTGNKVQAYYSEDGQDWTARGEQKEITTISTGLKAGFYAAGGGDGIFKFSGLTVKIGEDDVQDIPLVYMNTAPEASGVTCSNTDGRLHAEYVFTDNNDGGTEGTSIIRWMESGKADGTYSLVPGLTGADVIAPLSLAGKYIKAVVIPQNGKGIYGEPVMASLPVLVDEEQLPAGISITGGTETVQEIGKEVLYKANIEPSGAKETVNWKVVDAATGGETTHATIDAGGKLTTISNGAVEIVATTINGLEARKLLVINKDTPGLAPGITVENESNANQANWQATEDGIIQTKALAGGIWATQTANNIFSCPLGDVEDVTVTIKLDGKTKSGWQEVGLLLFKDTDNYVFIGRKHNGGTPKIRVVNEESGTGNEGSGTNDISSDILYLKLEKRGNKVQAYFSEDGQNWTARGDEKENASISTGLKAGFYAAGGGDGIFKFSELTVQAGSGDVQDIPLAYTNTAPEASKVTCSSEDGRLAAEYEFSDSNDGDTEGTPIIRWMASESADGDYELLPGMYGNGNYVPALLSGMYLKAVVIPQDRNGLYGAPAVQAAPLLAEADSMSLPLSESYLQTASITGVQPFEEFSSGTKYYMATATAGQKEAVAAFAAKDSNASLEVTLNGKTVAGEEDGRLSAVNLTLPLIAGANVICVKVTAEDGMSQTEYRFTILRTGDTNAGVTEIRMNGEPLEDLVPVEGFVENMVLYEAPVNAGNLKVEVDTESSNASVMVTVNNEIYKENPADVTLKKGMNRIVITVRSEDLVHVNRYKIIALLSTEVDKSVLKAAIKEAGKLAASDYTAESWANLQAALEEAKAVSNNPDATQDEIDTVALALEEAIDALERSGNACVVTFDKNAIQNAGIGVLLNGKEFVSGNSVIYGDILDITIKPDEGYCFYDNPVVSVKNGSITISVEESTSNCYKASISGFKASTEILISGKVEKVKVKDETNPENNVGAAQLAPGFIQDIGDNIKYILQNNDKLSDEEIANVKNALENGGTVGVELSVTDNKINTEEAKKGTDAISSEDGNAKDRAVPLDILLETICMDASGNEVARVAADKLDKEIKISIKAKEIFKDKWSEKPNGVTRKYFVIRIHDGKTDKLACTYNDGRIEFKSALFSTYVFYYEDVKEETALPVYPPYVSGGVATPEASAAPSASAVPAVTPVPSVSAVPVVTPEPSASAAPSETLPGTSSKPGTTPPPGDKDDDKNTGSNAVKVKAGNKVTVNSSKYKVTSVSGTRTVQFTSGKKNAKNVVIPAAVKISGKNYKVTSIADNAFKNNKKLKKVTIGINVNKIGKAAFKGCKNLKSIVIKTKKLTAKKVGVNAFKGINKKAVFKVPKNKAKAYKKIVKSKGAAKTVKIKK